MENEDTQNFEKVDINSFFDVHEEKETSKVVIFTTKQQALVNEIMPMLHKNDEDTGQNFRNRITDLEALASAINRFPSLLERHSIIGDIRTPNSLIDSLIGHLDSGDSTLQLPSKANLGKGLLIAKMHTLSRLGREAKFLGQEKLAKEFETETISSMFSLLVEDVYLNLIRDKSQPMEFRREWAMSLLLLWEHWSDQNIEDVAPVLQAVWTARRRLAPAFGTMMGTSELMMISMQMDEQWIQFIKEKMGEPGVTQAMEEFLFGISYEQIKTLKNTLRTKGISAIGRDEVSKFLGEHVKADAGLDYRDFYSLYTVRRDNARSRGRFKTEGPYKTLEDYYIQFVTEQNKEKQKNDTFAK